MKNLSEIVKDKEKLVETMYNDFARRRAWASAAKCEMALAGDEDAAYAVLEYIKTENPCFVDGKPVIYFGPIGRKYDRQHSK